MTKEKYGSKNWADIGSRQLKTVSDDELNKRLKAAKNKFNRVAKQYKEHGYYDYEAEKTQFNSNYAKEVEMMMKQKQLKDMTRSEKEILFRKMDVVMNVNKEFSYSKFEKSQIVALSQFIGEEQAIEAIKVYKVGGEIWKEIDKIRNSKYYQRFSKSKDKYKLLTTILKDVFDVSTKTLYDRLRYVSKKSYFAEQDYSSTAVSYGGVKIDTAMPSDFDIKEREVYKKSLYKKNRKKYKRDLSTELNNIEEPQVTKTKSHIKYKRATKKI